MIKTKVGRDPDPVTGLAPTMITIADRAATTKVAPVVEVGVDRVLAATAATRIAAAPAVLPVVVVVGKRKRRIKTRMTFLYHQETNSGS